MDNKPQQGFKTPKGRAINVHDESGQEYRVVMNNGVVVKGRKLNSRVTILPTIQPLDLGIRAFKKVLKIQGKSKHEINQAARSYKARAYAELEKQHAPYVKQTASFEKLEIAEGVTIR